MNSTSDVGTKLRRRIRQQEVVAELGRQSLEVGGFDELLRDAATAAADALDAAFAAVLEVNPDGRTAVLRAGVGWPRGVVGSATVPVTLDGRTTGASCRYWSRADDETRTDATELGPELFVEQGITDEIDVVVGPVDDPWGIMGVYTAEQRAFTEHDVTFVQSIANIVAKAAETERTHHKLEEIYGRISDGFFAVDENWNFTYLNERAHELINPEGRTLVGKNIWEEFPPPLRTQFRKKYERAMCRQEATSFEEYYPEPLDSWFEVRIYPSKTGLSVYVRDITERKDRERELELFRELLDHCHDSVLVIEPETGRFLDVNETARERLGYEREELLELSVHDMERRFADLEEWRSHVEDVELEGSVMITGEHVRKDGSTYPAEVNVAYVGLDREYMVAIARDVTERRERQRELEASNERLEQFAYAASHDLQEPLRMISSYLGLLEKRYADAFDEEGEEFLAYAVDGADRMRAMIDGLLEYSRVETRGDPFESVDLEALAEDVRTDLRLQIEESGAEITTDGLDRVEGDACQLRQLFQNLFSNAITYSGDEPPRIRVESERRGERVLVSVHDEGIGIDLDNQDRIFEVFQRLHNHTEYAGTGIGLALCRRIVERHDGEIEVDSDLGEGSTFSVTLPAS
jgi:PAS domain S-box-containing protein